MERIQYGGAGTKERVYGSVSPRIASVLFADDVVPMACIIGL